ncbi:hypothetical protein Zmor_002619 [Zophobas morio]|uniref:Uncharacterized protein n=1 Tax=Zophobas morio TaxID=2755281 RepID=A0AA38J6U8_9CUCU|nr:hypothetical protein Zmor_002619 [Zophobas morio]
MKAAFLFFSRFSRKTYLAMRGGVSCGYVSRRNYYRLMCGTGVLCSSHYSQQKVVKQNNTTLPRSGGVDVGPRAAPSNGERTARDDFMWFHANITCVGVVRL